MNTQIKIPAPVRVLLSRLNDRGFAAYAVGGCVRDSLLHKAPQDWDICTAARPEEIKACFTDCRTILTGERYGTVTVLYESVPYEITTFRTENGYADSRHPDTVLFVDSLQNDLSRRDFTVNAMAADAEGNVIDCFGGIADLQNGILRCVGNAETRFTEDALRILRALRFAAKLDFSIARETASAIFSLKERLHLVASERIRKELGGLLCGTAAVRVLRDYAEILCIPIPELARCIGFRQYNYHHSYDVWEHTLRVLEQVPPTEELRLAALLHDVGKPSAFTMDKNAVGHFYSHAEIGAAICESVLRRLHYDNATVQRVTLLVREHGFSLPQGSEKRMKKLLAAFGEDAVRSLLLLRRADAIGTGTVLPSEADASLQDSLALLETVLRKTDCFSLNRLAVGGDDLISLGLPQGKQVGAVLQRLFEAVLEERLPNERQALLQAAKDMIDKPFSR